MLSMISQSRDGFFSTSKTQVETLEEHYAFMALSLWKNMVSSTTDFVAYWTYYSHLVAIPH